MTAAGGITREKKIHDVDGLLTNHPRVILCTLYADCVPLLFVDPIRRVVASSHSGWKGTVARMGAVTVERMVSAYGCRREDILVGIGPSIGPCCFEVDAPVYEAFASLDDLFDGGCFQAPPTENTIWISGKSTAASFCTAYLREDHITVTDLCTPLLTGRVLVPPGGGRRPRQPGRFYRADSLIPALRLQQRRFLYALSCRGHDSVLLFTAFADG